MKIQKSKKGFTLIELIVVIAVLALLAAVAVPMISGWVDRAQEGERAANARTIELAVKAHMAEIGEKTVTEAYMNAALTKFGIPNSISGSSGNYSVSSQGVVTHTGGGNGAISFN